jgi:hypothetical protein
MTQGMRRPGLQPPAIEPPARPRVAPDDPRFMVAENLERPEAVREAVAAGRVRALNAETAAGLLGGQAPAGRAARRTTPEVALSTRVPDYVLRQLRRRYAESGVTIRNQILFALRLAGIEVRDEDLHDERRRGRALR